MNMNSSLLPVAAAALLISTSVSAAEPDGAALFNQTCVVCHGKNAQGAIPGVPDLTRKDGMLTESDAHLVASILNGVQTKGSPMAMPPKGGNPKLTPEDAIALVAYLRALVKK